MEEKKSFKLKEVADACYFNYNDLKYLERKNVVPDIVHPGNYGEMLHKDRGKWVRLYPEEAVAIAYVATIYQNIKLLEPSKYAAKKAVQSLPLIFLNEIPGVRCLPWLVIGEKYPEKYKLDSGRPIETGQELIEIDTLQPFQAETDFPIQLNIGSRKVNVSGDKIQRDNCLTFYGIGDLLFQFLKNLNMELTDLDPDIIWSTSTPGLYFPGKNRREFQLEFFRFAIQDLDKILKYLET